MPEPKEIKRLLREVVGSRLNLPLTGTVDSIEGDTCTVELKGGLKVSDVKLKATVGSSEGYILIKPKEGTKVVCLSFTGDPDSLTVIKTDEAQSVDLVIGDISFYADEEVVKINGEDFGGLVKAPELKTQIDKNTAILKAIQNAFENWQQSSGDGAVGLKTLSANFSMLDRADLSDIENEKVKHG